MLIQKIALLLLLLFATTNDDIIILLIGLLLVSNFALANLSCVTTFIFVAFAIFTRVLFFLLDE